MSKLDFTIYTQNFNIRENDKYKEYIDVLNNKNNNIHYNDILYSLIDIIDEGWIEIDTIRKIYTIQESSSSNDGVKRKRNYITYKIEIKVQILDKSKIKEYYEFKCDQFMELMSGLFKHKNLNSICNPNSFYRTVNNNERYEKLEVDEPEFDVFDLHPNFVNWLD